MTPAPAVPVAAATILLLRGDHARLEVFMVVAILYLAMTTCWDFVQRRIEAYYGKAYGAAADKQLARDDH